MQVKTAVAVVSLIILTVVTVAFNQRASASSAAEEEMRRVVTEIFETRALAVVTGADPGPALACYDTSRLLGRWAISHEESKLNYMQLWAKKRGVQITEAKCLLTIPWSRAGAENAELVVNQALQLCYKYPGDSRENRFSIGTRHWMKLVLKDSKWLIEQDFYTDALGDDFLVANPVPADGPAVAGLSEKPAAAQKGNSVVFDREGAVRYADKYAGLALGSDHNCHYNPQYRDMNDLGGDCANYVSQCLGDPEGGKLPVDWSWFYDRKEQAGSQCWVRAESFGDWIMFSGRGRRIARGTFEELNQPSADFPRGAAAELREGDVIGYGERGFSRHLAIVTGTDLRGYPVVNAHNVDRFHCPWDLGYDKTTVYHLYRIMEE